MLRMKNCNFTFVLSSLIFIPGFQNLEKNLKLFPAFVNAVKRKQLKVINSKIKMKWKSANGGLII